MFRRLQLHSTRAFALLRELAAFVGGRRKAFRVDGDSMTPTLMPGDVVVVEKTRGGVPEPGEVVVVSDPARPGRTLVKRARSLGSNGQTFCVGSDAPQEARDSRHFGSLRAEDFVGRVRWAWSPKRGLRGVRAVAAR